MVYHGILYYMTCHHSRIHRYPLQCNINSCIFPYTLRLSIILCHIVYYFVLFSIIILGKIISCHIKSCHVILHYLIVCCVMLCYAEVLVCRSYRMSKPYLAYEGAFRGPCLPKLAGDVLCLCTRVTEC